MKQKETALVCFSGGQDSTTCLFWALSHFESVEAVCFIYGQKHVKEVDVARKIAAEAGVPFEVLDVSLIGQLTHNSLTDSSMVMDKEKPEDSYPNTFVPGRNMVFLTFAAIKAFQKGIRHLAMDAHFEIHTPLMWRDKESVWRLSDELGVFDLVRNETLTCYNGIPADGCGECPACKLRKHGLDLYLKHRNG